MKFITITLLLLLVAPAPAFGLTKTESMVLKEINKARIAHNVLPVTVAPALTKSSALKAEYMKKHHFFAHNWNGLSWLWWVRKYYPGPAGENLSYTVSAESVVNRWLGSPSHRSNMLNPFWRHIGLRALNIDAPLPRPPGPNRTVIVTHYGL